MELFRSEPMILVDLTSGGISHGGTGYYLDMNMMGVTGSENGVYPKFAMLHRKYDSSSDRGFAIFTQKYHQTEMGHGI